MMLFDSLDFKFLKEKEPTKKQVLEITMNILDAITLGYLHYSPNVFRYSPTLIDSLIAHIMDNAKLNTVLITYGIK